MNKEDSDDEKLTKFFIFTALASILQREMFDYGLPVRGAITSGSFILAESCFAGTPIVEAYKLASQLDLATCVIQNKILSDAITIGVFYGRGLIYIQSYLTPFKGRDVESFVICPAMFEGVTNTSWRNVDLKQLVAEAFWKHKKQIGNEVVSKLNNTELFLRFIKMRLGEKFR